MVEHIAVVLNVYMSVNDGKCEMDIVRKRFIDIIKTKDISRFCYIVEMLDKRSQ